MTRDLVFKRVKEFKIGELEITMYELKPILLFDFKDLVNKIDTEEYKDKDHALRCLKRQMSWDTIQTVIVQEGGGNKYIEKSLFTVQGVYEIIFLIQSDETMKMRRNFINILEEYRRNNGMEIDKFLQFAYENNKIPLHSLEDGRGSFPDECVGILDNISNEVILATHAFRFPIINDLIVYKLNSRYFLDHLDNGRKGIKIEYLLGCKETLRALSTILLTDQVSILNDIGNSLITYEINGNLYYEPDKLINLLFKKLNSEEKTEKVFLNMLYEITKNKELSELLLKSVTYYEFVHSDLSLELYYKIK